MPSFLILTTAGAGAGVAGHLLLSRMNRGARVHPAWLVLGVAALWTLAGWRTTTGRLPWWWLPIPLLAAWLAVTLTVVDLKHRRLPDTLTLSAYPATAAVVLLASTQAGWRTAEDALLGAAALATVYALVHVISPRSLGAGDVKLSGSQGAVLGAVGWPAVVVGATLAALLTLLLNAVVPGRLRATWRTGIPHGPALVAATYVIATFPAPP